MKRYYTAPSGEKYPLIEAKWDISMPVYKSDRRKAVPGDPEHCLIALGIKRNPDVLYVYIGSGRDAYVVFKNGKKPFAVHFVINQTAREVLDKFDQDKTAQTQTVTLKRPARSWQLEYRRQSNARRREEIKNGADVKHRNGKNVTRITRLGVPHRPHAPISRNGSVDVYPAA